MTSCVKYDPFRRTQLGGVIEVIQLGGVVGFSLLKATQRVKKLKPMRPSSGRSSGRSIPWTDQKFGKIIDFDKFNNLNDLNDLITKLYSPRDPDNPNGIFDRCKSRFDCVFTTLCIYKFYNIREVTVDECLLYHYITPITQMGLLGPFYTVITNPNLSSKLNGEGSDRHIPDMGGFVIFSEREDIPHMTYKRLYSSFRTYVNLRNKDSYGYNLNSLYSNVFSQLRNERFMNGIYIIFCIKLNGDGYSFGSGHYHCILKHASILYYIDPHEYETAVVIDDIFENDLPKRFNGLDGWLISVQLPPAVTTTHIGGRKTLKKKRKSLKKKRKTLKKKSKSKKIKYRKNKKLTKRR